MKPTVKNYLTVQDKQSLMRKPNLINSESFRIPYMKVTLPFSKGGANLVMLHAAFPNSS